MNMERFMGIISALVLVLMLVGAVVVAIAEGEKSLNEKEDFCEERGMVYSTSPGLPEKKNCLKIDQDKKIIEVHRIQKINGEYYLEWKNKPTKNLNYL